MIARVADHCFWFGRYLERAESTARLLAATTTLALDAELPAALCWRPVIVVAGEEAQFAARHDAADPAAPAWGNGELVQRFMTWDDRAGVSLQASINAARWNARAIRDVVSLEAWEVVNELQLWMGGSAAAAEWHGARDGFYRHVRRMTQLTLGLLRSTMLHDEPLNFIWLGVLLERVGQTARTLDVHHHALDELATAALGLGADDAEAGREVVATALWLTLLRALSGSEPFARRVHGRITADAVARFLVDEPLFPRSIAYGVHAAHDRLAAISRGANVATPGAALTRLADLEAWLGHAAQADRSVVATHALLTRVVDDVHAACDDLGREFLGHM